MPLRSPRNCPASLAPEPDRIDLGLKQLAFVTITGALLDAMGRDASCYRANARRQNAADAIRWLRVARVEARDLTPFSIVWCAHILDLDARKIALTGVARIPNSGLRNWRYGRQNAT